MQIVFNKIKMATVIQDTGYSNIVGYSELFQLITDYDNSAQTDEDLLAIYRCGTIDALLRLRVTVKLKRICDTIDSYLKVGLVYVDGNIHSIVFKGDALQSLYRREYSLSVINSPYRDVILSIWK